MSTGQIAATLTYINLLVMYTAVSVVDWINFHDDPTAYVEAMRRRFPATSDWYTDEGYMLQVQRLPIRILILSAAIVVSLVVFVLPLV